MGVAKGDVLVPEVGEQHPGWRGLERNEEGDATHPGDGNQRGQDPLLAAGGRLGRLFELGLRRSLFFDSSPGRTSHLIPPTVSQRLTP
jgi:hypothetical protein